MKPDATLSQRPALQRAARAHALHCPFQSTGVSRRHFLQSTAGLAAFAATLGSSRTVEAQGIGLVVPIPSTLEIFGEQFHVLAPPITAVDDDPSTVFNFEGSVGLAFISGTAHRTNRKTGESQTMPYMFNDMRFMQGRFVGRDGHARNGTFAFT
jgi:hypothetical protein